MTATDELRRLLDEHGVEWESKDIEDISDFHDTRWNAHNVQWCYVEFVGNNYTKLKPSSEFHCTPEQAIAVTLSGVDGKSRAERTCHKVIPDEMEGYVFCSECGAEIGEYGYPNYCPNCGCKVMS